MGLAALDAALAGLKVSQQQINVISNNVANAGTPGFTRKILPQSAQAINGLTVGVAPETVIRNVDLNLSRDLWTQVSAVGSLDVQKAYLSRVEQFHGPPDAELSVAAEISRLKDGFAGLSDTPEDPFLLASTVNAAVDTANKINDLSTLLTTLRNDAQSDISSAVGRINALLSQIANLNDQIQDNGNVNRSVAVAQDQRDEAIKELSSLMEVSFFQRGDGVLVVQSNNGTELVTERANRLVFDPNPVAAQSYYPDSAAAIYVVDGAFTGDDPTTDPATVDITATQPGGRLGGLITLRDETFPKQMAQLDELAHKIALRFDAQGLRLFTDSIGSIPGDTAPDPTTIPNPTAVEYVGFSAEIQVNSAILADSRILQQGTVATDQQIDGGSSEVISRILEYTFGSVDYQEAVGVVDIRAAATGGATLQDWLGVFSENTLTSARDLASIGPDLITTPGSPFAPAGADTFDIIIDPAGEGVGPLAFNVDMNAVAPAGNATAADLAAHIDALDPNISARVNPNGQLEITSRWDLQIDATTPPGAMGATGLQFLGLGEGTFDATDPYFEVQVGNDPVRRITIEPGDTETELLDKLDYTGGADAAGVFGLAVSTSADGYLSLRPGDDYNNPTFGGDMKIISGPFSVDAALAGINGGPGPGSGPGTLEDGISLVAALFGSYTPAAGGTPAQNVSPVTSQSYGSEVSASNTSTNAFREDFLGPSADISINVVGAFGLIDFAQKMVSEHSQEIQTLEGRQEDEQTLQEILQRQLLDESGVNLDEELSNLIVQQTAYSAAARVVNAVNSLFEELINSV